MPVLEEKILLDAAIKFTETFKIHKEGSIPGREAACLAVQFPALLEDIREGDLFAGRMDKWRYYVKFAPQSFSTQFGLMQQGDRSGITCMLSSVAKPGAANGGYITNLKLSSEMFRGKRPLLESILRTFFKKGGMQLNITVTSRQDLLNALENPGEYAHILIRVGGWAARFIDLSKPFQTEIINRTQY